MDQDKHDVIDWVTPPVLAHVWLIVDEFRCVLGVYDSEVKAQDVLKVFPPGRVTLSRMLVQ